MIYLLLDSAADYDVKGKEGYKFVPITVSLNGKDYRDGIDLDKDAFYELLTSGEEFPKTSQPSPQVFVELFEQVRDSGDELIYLALSSALSGTYQSAVIAKEMVDYDGIYLVDTCSVTCGIQFLAENAERLRDSGATAEEIVKSTEELKTKVHLMAAVDTLEYLYRGGRLSRGAAAVGTVAGVKPTIALSREGTVAVLGKSLGKKKAMRSLLKILSENELDERYPIYSLYSYGVENCEELEQELIAEGHTLGRRFQIGSAIGAHVGPGAYGVLYVEK